ncbi:MAG: hypothetical protein HYX67_04095 [Candidatus Melainabacteria bacterium]|nr:hypothetical protein [Candidatus Melainabacteria bacterium]
MRKAALLLSILFLLSTFSQTFAQTPDECLVKVQSMEPMLPKVINGARASIHEIIPDPAAYEKTLPPLDKVIKDKDVLNFKNYGGLSEAYFFSGNAPDGQRIYTTFAANSTNVLGADDTYAAYVGGDLGILNFIDNKYSDAENYLLPAIKQLESHLTPAISNNLIADYLCITLIRSKSTKETEKAEASKYAKKLIDLVIKQRQPY